MDPMFTAHLAVMTRQLTEVCKDEKSSLAKYPQDYEVYEIGDYDETRGIIIPIEPKFVMNISEITNELNLGRTHDKTK